MWLKKENIKKKQQSIACQIVVPIETFFVTIHSFEDSNEGNKSEFSTNLG